MATRITCGECGAAIAGEDVNVAADTAYCRACGALSRPSRMLADAEAGVDTALDDVPSGCVVEEGFGYGRTLRVSGRSVTGAGEALFVALFWNGIVSIFVSLAVPGTLRLAGVGVPAWFPVPGARRDGFITSVGLAVFLWLFLLPFFAMGLMFMGLAVVSLFGHVSVRIGPDGGRVFTGVGPVGWARRFDPAAVESVAVGLARWQQNDRSVPAVVISRRARGPLRFGTMLTAERRAWLVAATRKALADREGGRPRQ